MAQIQNQQLNASKRARGGFEIQISHRRYPLKKAVVAWDMENIAVPTKGRISAIMDIVREKMYAKVGHQLHVEFIVFIRGGKL
eukprot:CAMPEP_0201586414 /NCGR_PEP_ID=MMETSP0190_2-20130828/132678_1 /ASSEMBLY_ACC=CAM_ASM_000263 /TAXON_ID=37353 /ORGANISM="Rosalina sp." /LENGTH=82 /DNA_ID=CAMNT_0048034405 /DNA_START=14 /DNA_END=259 /DNA_ORIENTATION=-